MKYNALTMEAKMNAQPTTQCHTFQLDCTCIYSHNIIIMSKNGVYIPEM